MEVSVIGINHRTAPVEARERVALSREQVERLLLTVRAERLLDEAVILSTCNRTEFYLVNGAAEDVLPHLLRHVGELKGEARLSDASGFYRHSGLATAEHLFRVAASLDSQMVGEDEILGQVRQAYRLALAARATRLLLNKLFHWALRVGKRVRAETAIGRGPVGVPQAAVELARRALGGLAGRAALVIGAGEAGELAARALLRAGAGEVVVANRTISAADELAARLIADMRSAAGSRRVAEAPHAPVKCVLSRRNGGGGDGGPSVEAIGLDGIGSAFRRADVVVCSAGAPEPILTPKNCGDCAREPGRTVVVIDIAMPRGVAAGLGELPAVALYDMGDLDALVAENTKARRGAVVEAEAIVAEEVGKFGAWWNSRQVVPTIKLLRRHLDSLKYETLQRHGGRAGDSHEDLKAFADSLHNKVLHNPVTFLKELSHEGRASDVLAAVDLVRRMFDLDALEETE